ncbi:MAG: family 16 glycoside hydrolase [Planctomycetota bacterium]|nr:family 16 glycoside hydrolase [Planctomycetota bacterium]
MTTKPQTRPGLSRLRLVRLAQVGAKLLPWWTPFQRAQGMRSLRDIVPLLLLAVVGCSPSGSPPAATEDRTTTAPSGNPQPAAQEAPVSNAKSDAPAALPAVSESPRPLSDQDLVDGWISLFDGQTLFGWSAHSDVNWRIEQGAIVADEGEVGLLCTTTQFADFQLRVDFLPEALTNSGVFLRTAPVITKDDVTTECYELNIAPADNPFPTGSLVGRQKIEGDFHRAEWQTYLITAQGDRIEIQLNGKQILSYQDKNPIQRGRIGLQFNSGRIAFRNVEIKPLGLQPLFNGKDLTGWTEYPDMATQFSVSNEGALIARNQGEGRGQLETEQKYGDFVLQLEAMTHAPNLNSGIFFRCIPGEVMNGYESQIHFGFEAGNRRKPSDCGTGGIFRRQNARLVVGDDQTWVHQTLIADGPHMAAWVNGYPVSDWTDERAPDPNPRRGKRLEPGTLMLQGHDATTHLSFRNLKIVEIPKR